MAHETWTATAIIKPVHKVGTKEECEEWCRSVFGKEITIVDPDGGICVGVVSETRAEAMRTED